MMDRLTRESIVQSPERTLSLEPRAHAFAREPVGATAGKPSPEPRAPTYIGIFFVALATLMYEILLTRIFSVTMFYH